MECEKHKTPLIMLAGKAVCVECLAEKRRQPIVFENLAALNEMPSHLRTFRLKDFQFLGKGFITALSKLTHLNMEELGFNILWLHHENHIELSQLLGALCNERLLIRNPSQYLNFEDNWLLPFEDLSQLLRSIQGTPFIAIDRFNKISSNRAPLTYRLVSNLFLSAITQGQCIVIGSQYTFDSMLNEPYLKREFTRIQPFVKMIGLKKNGK